MRLKLILPIVVIIALGAGAWLFLESSGNSDQAGKTNTHKDIMNMSEAEFEKLDEASLKQMRGDDL